MTEQRDDTVVKKGGIGDGDAETEDVTRDTYGFPEPEQPPSDRDERIAEANRAAEQEGMPGVEIPD